MFGNFLLADEINRAPAKVQSALLEVMQERQVTIGGQTYPRARARSSSSPRRTRSSPRAPTRCPRRRSTASCSSCSSTTRRSGEEAAVVGRSIGAGVAGARAPRRSTDLERYRALVARACFVDRDVIAYAVALADATRHPGTLRAATSSRRSSSTARARAGRSAWSRPPRRSRCCAAAATWSPRTSRDLAPDVLRHRLVLVLRRARRRRHGRRPARPRPGRRRQRRRRPRRGGSAA